MFLRNLMNSGIVFAPPGEEGSAAPVETTNDPVTDAGDEGAANGADAANDTAAAAGDEGAAAGDEANKEDEVAKTAAAEAAKKAQEEEDWRDKELKRKHAQIKERDRKLAEIERENADLRAIAEGRKPANEEGTAKPAPAAGSEEERIKAEAARLVAEERRKDNLTKINENGEKQYGDSWNKALDRLATFGTVDEGDLTTIMNTDDPSKVLYELGSNPAEYQRLLDMSPERRRVEIIKISLRESKSTRPKPSSAPAPTDPVRARATPQPGLRDDLSDDEWFALREKERKARFEQRQRAGR